MSDEKQWYSNKDLFEKISLLQVEMRETRTAIKKYNGIWEKLNNLSRKINTLESINSSNSKFRDGFRLWGGWIFGLLSILILIYTTFIVS